MIDEALAFLTARLDLHLRGRFRSEEPKLAVLAALAGADAAASAEIANRIVLTLIAIAREPHALNAPQRPQTGETVRVAPLQVNLTVLVSAQYDRAYGEGLRALSSTLGYFHAQPAFHASVFADLPKGIDRLTLELVDLDLQAMNNIWSVLGGRHRPAVVYKVRMVPIPPESDTLAPPPVRIVDVDPLRT